MFLMNYNRPYTSSLLTSNEEMLMSVYLVMRVTSILLLAMINEMTFYRCLVRRINACVGRAKCV